MILENIAQQEWKLFVFKEASIKMNCFGEFDKVPWGSETFENQFREMSSYDTQIQQSSGRLIDLLRNK